MREIKFRAWDKTEQKMHEWDYLIGYCDLDWLFGDHASFRPDIEVMQYTGLHDANGVEIYEGDIVFIKRDDSVRSIKQEVVFDTDNGAFITKRYLKGLEEWDLLPLHYFGQENIEVIGNIHENQELVNT